MSIKYSKGIGDIWLIEYTVALELFTQKYHLMNVFWPSKYLQIKNKSGLNCSKTV